MILAQGNQAFGYSLYLADGLPRFTIRLSGLTLEVHGQEPVKLRQWMHLAATVDAEGRITLLVNRKPAGRLEQGHFVTQTPRDAFNVGADLGGAVGDYDSPRHFRGLIEDVRVYWGILDQAAFDKWAGL